VLPPMKERRWGRIINVLNVGAKAPRAGGAPTAVTRAAGMALSKVLAGEGAPFNVLVNAMNTGILVSDQWVRRHAASDGSESFDDFVARMGKTVPLGRMGQAEEFANLACFLASDMASYITGTSINVDGGSSPVV
jgi:3-oxoacyl-[acyl-carrier protein] reductase